MKFRFWLLLLPIILLSIGCKNKPQKTIEKKPVISVSILPQKYFLEKIAGKKFEINVLLPPGASPATFDPTPKQILQLSESGIYFLIGHLAMEENSILSRRKDLKNVRFANVSENIDMIDSEEHDGHGHGHLIDPHTWMTPENVKIIAKNMAVVLSEEYPEKEDFFESNLYLFEKQLDTLDAWIRLKLEHLSKHQFIIYHPALTYYANTYGLEQIPIEYEGKEPSPAYLGQLIQYAQQHDIRTIFIQKQFNKSEAETLGKETDARLIEIDPLSYEWDKELEHITNALAEILR
ncbi:MAG: zinc ABC transporter substrate-binding protein [Bacteroidales bacterium]|nr:zinc ABC transporter substrate-binding protein [Bacteroidales bacterium]